MFAKLQAFVAAARTVGLAATLLATPALAQAQAPAKPVEPAKKVEVSNADILQAVNQLSQRLINVDDRLRSVESRLGEAVSREEYDALVELLRGHSDDIKSLREELNTVRSELRAQSGDVQQLVEGITRRDSAGRPIVNLRSIMESDEFRGEMGDAVNKALKTEGDFVVENRMATEQVLRVNGRDHTIAPGTTATIRAPVGTVETELVGYEAPKTWTIGAPLYRQRIQIAPRPAPTPAPAALDSAWYLTPAYELR